MSCRLFEAFSHNHSLVWLTSQKTFLVTATRFLNNFDKLNASVFCRNQKRVSARKGEFLPCHSYNLGVTGGGGAGSYATVFNFPQTQNDAKTFFRWTSLKHSNFFVSRKLQFSLRLRLSFRSSSYTPTPRKIIFSLHFKIFQFHSVQLQNLGLGSGLLESKPTQNISNVRRTWGINAQE